ncbi:E3 ubiquitin-protein ligase mind-bomb-like isoform X2 [Mizuhopecten yessoensis]|uniref:Poly [ADP-ribose] polymerase n=1 Tax=Mizuhopecten yessoensis TaxID=6573 RepID=A0A210R0B1_MIZYE|nr:E3 ubiquitin-protein ligase mind-bomb-like isoform X2 [Mizuhopecten yessoensis]OWF54450.1 E3 ubiquitin-protein ligase MIB2 [Mizuhopecten yessoensis]
MIGHLKPGTRVVRGPDWNSKKQDSGEGYLGTVIYVPKSEMADKKVTVIWDSGRELRYRSGHDGKYDLRIFDTAQIGIKHEYVSCSECKETPIAGLRWKCSSCPDISLCSPCYMGDKHDIRHGFVRIDVEKATPWAVQKREGSRQEDSRGMFVGTEVMRGPHWKWKNVDGGEGEIGIVTKLKEWNSHSQRGGVSISWKNAKEEHLHRLGGEGCVDVIFNRSKQSKSGGKYYPEHLPLVDVVNKGNYTVALKPSDKVQVCMDVKALRQLQDNPDKHSPWSSEMEQCIKEVGTIVQLLHKGELARVQYVDGQIFDLNRKALTRIHTFSKDDLVEILGDKEKIKVLQAGHGGWNDDMEQVLQKQGRIARIDSDGDVRVKVDERVWIFNPVCIQASSPKGAEASSPPSLMGTTVVMDDDDDSSEEKEMSISGRDVSETIAQLFVDMLKVQPPVQAASANIVQAAAQNDINTIQQVLSQKPDKVNFSQDGKTALHLACYEGHSQVVTLLLKYNANLDLQDGEGDSALHYAAFGKETETMKQLLNAGAKVNIVNKAGHSPLHISIGKACEEAVEILVRHGSDVNIKADDGDTTMHDAVQQRMGQPRIMLAVLRGHDADYTIPNQDGFNVLQWAGLKNSVQAMDVILEMNKNFVNDQTAEGFTVLHIVAANNFVDATNCLVAKPNINVNIDIGDKEKKTPLHCAVNGGHKQVIELLIAAESDVNAQDVFGNTALHLALSKSGPSRECDKIMGAKQDHEVGTQIICLLLESRANIMLKNKDGDTPLDLASDPMVRKFMEKLADKAKHNKFETTKRGINLPSNWDPLTKGQAFTRVPVSVEAGGILKMEYENVSKKFRSTLPQAKIFTIQRVQNMFLWEVYYLKKRQLEGQYGMGGANELELFHGTLPDKIDKICKENLDFRLAGERVGAIFGQGTYFAVEAKYSDLYAQADEKRHKYMVLTRVLAGKSCVGKNQYRRPPPVDQSDPHSRLYDCCVDNVKNPKIFCLFDTNQYYPEYIIEYM